MLSIGVMRSIDYYFGVPLCALMTVYVKLAAFFQPRSARPLRNVLFIELSEMGTTILCDPALKKLQTQNLNIYFIIFRKNAESLNLLGTVPPTNIFTIRENHFLLMIWDTLRFALWARKNQIDSCIDLELFSRFTTLLGGLCGADRRVGFHRYHTEGLYRGNILTHPVMYNPHQHIAKNFIALTNALLSPGRESPFSKTAISDAEIGIQKVAINDSSSVRVRAVLAEVCPGFENRRLILMNPGGSDFIVQRKWPAEYYGEVIRKLLHEFEDVVVLLTGEQRERAELDRIVGMVGHERCINFSGRVAFKDLPALYSMAECLLTNDSGPAHFAAVTDLKTYVLYGPETPALYGSLGNSVALYSHLSCSPCVSAANHRQTTCNDNQCLKTIKPERVFNLMREHCRQA